MVLGSGIEKWYGANLIRIVDHQSDYDHSHIYIPYTAVTYCTIYMRLCGSSLCIVDCVPLEAPYQCLIMLQGSEPIDVPSDSASDSSAAPAAGTSSGEAGEGIAAGRAKGVCNDPL